MATKNTSTIVFPLHGCEAAAPLTSEQVEAQMRELENAIKKHWENDGVEAIVKLIEMESAIKTGRACVPGATPHDAGQGFALQQLVARIQALKWRRKA